MAAHHQLGRCIHKLFLKDVCTIYEMQITHLVQGCMQFHINTLHKKDTCCDMNHCGKIRKQNISVIMSLSIDFFSWCN